MSIERHPDKYRPTHRSKRGNKMRADVGKTSKFHASLLRGARLRRKQFEREARAHED